MALEKNENFFELTDESDRASAIEAQFNEDALENARRKKTGNSGHCSSAVLRVSPTKMSTRSWSGHRRRTRCRS